MCEGDRRQAECALPGQHGLPLCTQSRPWPRDLRQAPGRVTRDGQGSGRGRRRKLWAQARGCASLALACMAAVRLPSSSRGEELRWPPLPLPGLPPLVPKMQSELTTCCPEPSVAPQYPLDHGRGWVARPLDLSLFHATPLPGLHADSPLLGTLPPGLACPLSQSLPVVRAPGPPAQRLRGQVAAGQAHGGCLQMTGPSCSPADPGVRSPAWSAGAPGPAPPPSQD